MLEAASLLKVVLDELGLASFPQTSGGKGFHISVPLTHSQGWDEVKAFSQAVASTCPESCLNVSRRCWDRRTG